MTRTAPAICMAAMVGMATISTPARADEASCQALASDALPDLQIEARAWVPAGPDADAKQDLPAYCKITGILGARTGANGTAFGDRFELRLPEDWNHRFYFQGGGGTDGQLRPAYGGGQPEGQPAAVARGFAVISTDGGHEDKDSSFGLDSQAREDWGYQVIHDVATAGKALVASYYGRPAAHSYLVGCSNGGRQGMMASQRYPTLFDGIVAGDPVFRMSRSHVDTAWGLQKLTAIAPRNAEGAPILSRAFSDAQLARVAAGIVAACDGLDGLEDGLVQDSAACHFDPATLACPAAGQDCLSAPQVQTLVALQQGSQDSKGRHFYVPWPDDPAIGAADWRKWRLGTSETSVPNAIKAGLSNNAIKHVFLTPPDPDFDIADFDFDRDPQRMEASAAFADATSTDLSAFRAAGGRILFYHGTGDAAISSNDTARYVDALTEAAGGPAETAQFARYFPVPGMGHCRGGVGGDAFDVLSAIVAWVEDGTAPDRLVASGGTLGTQTRPLCPWPKVARYDGKGPKDSAASFNCE